MDALSLKLNVSISEHVSPETDMDKDKDTEDHPKDNEKADPDKHNDNEKDPMVRKVEKDEEAELYKHYTIQMLHAPRQNEKASHLYQMLRVTEPTIDGRCKQLDMMCFPDLFPFGVGGMHLLK